MKAEEIIIPEASMLNIDEYKALREKADSNRFKNDDPFKEVIKKTAMLYIVNHQNLVKQPINQ